jgi:hypothetical protein
VRMFIDLMIGGCIGQAYLEMNFIALSPKALRRPSHALLVNPHRPASRALHRVLPRRAKLVSPQWRPLMMRTASRRLTRPMRMRTLIKKWISGVCSFAYDCL